MVRRQILSACRPRILGKGAGHDQNPLRNPRRNPRLEEARKAFESFIEAAHKATAQAEGTATALQSSAKDVSAKALSFTEANLKAAFDHAQMLIQAKDPPGNPRPSVRICEEAARRHGGASEGAGHAVLKAVTRTSNHALHLARTTQWQTRARVLSRRCGLAVSWSGWQVLRMAHQLARYLLVAMPRVSGLRR